MGITVSIKTTASMLVLTFRVDIRPIRPLSQIELSAQLKYIGYLPHLINVQEARGEESVDSSLISVLRIAIF
jgi:hypothetical protein